MARSIDPAPRAVRGFVPARTDEERFLMRHIEDLARTAQSRGIARYSGFLSDREQELARAALGRAGLEEGFRFDGGWPEAERRILCLEPEYSYPENPICCVQLQCRAQAGAVLPAHKDYLGSLMGLEIRREALGDIVLPPDAPGTAYVFALEPAARLICQELLQAGRTELATRLLAPDEVPEFRTAERRKCTATVSSLRLDAVLAAMNRRYTRAHYLELVRKLRDVLPEIALSTDIIVGFPGETAKDFEDTYRLVDEVGYHQVFTFIYSKREGTPAASVDDPTPRDVIQGRFDRLVDLVQKRAFEANQADLGSTVDVLVEGASKRDAGLLAGKSPKNQTVHAPLPEGTSIEELAGTTVRVRIDEAKTWYLAGEVAEGSEPPAEAADGR